MPHNLHFSKWTIVMRKLFAIVQFKLCNKYNHYNLINTELLNKKKKINQKEK